MPQSELAERIGVSRQTIRAIESGSAVPSTVIALRLAKVLGASVEEIFQESPDVARADVVIEGNRLEVGDRVVVAQIDGRTVVHPAELSPGQAIPIAPHVHVVGSEGDGTKPEMIGFGQRDAAPWTIIAGCDPALSLLASHASSSRGESQVFWRNANNGTAKRMLERGTTHVAALHGPGEGSQHVSMPAELLTSCTKVHLAAWQLGWVVRRGNPLGFRDASHLQSGKLRIVNRPIGAGARALLDDELSRAGVRPQQVSQYEWTVGGHLEVAMAVDAGAADVGIAVAGVAQAMHLDFIPIRDERCDLWIPHRHMSEPGVQQLLESLASDVFRWDLARFGSYDVAHTGEMVDVHAFH